MEKFEGRRDILLIILVAAAVILILKAAQMQLIDKTYRLKAESTTIGHSINYPARGLFKDRNGKILVQNEPIFDLMLTIKQMDSKMDTVKFCELLNIEKKEFEDRVQKDFSKPWFSKSIPFIFYSKLSAEQFAPLQEVLYEFPGFDYIVRDKRSFPFSSGAHVLGYMSEVNQDQIDNSNGEYRRGDYTGITGLEAYYEKQLKGEKGVSFVLKDNIGRVVEPLNGGSLDTVATSGMELLTALDIDLQTYGEELMKFKSGAIVAIEPKTGEILASISSPTYDPNSLSIGISRGKDYNALSRDTLNPLLNRTIMSKYPPGSLIKPIWALIALQEGIVESKDRISCTGGYTYNAKTWKCHAGPGVHNLISALQYSCNTYFYIAYKNLIETDGFNNPSVGLDLVNSYFEKAGIGHKLGVDIYGESPGFVPTPDFYKNLYASEGGRWYATYTISNGIGQGEFELTTMQMANLAAMIANRGYYYTPHYSRALNLLDKKNEIYFEKHNFPVDKEHFEPVIEGMSRAVTRGTALQAYIPNIEVCGKTGTSQNSGLDHSVFFAFAPRDDPKIAIAVYVENAGWGSSFAAPIAGLMIEKYLKGEISNTRKWLETRMLNAKVNQ